MQHSTFRLAVAAAMTLALVLGAAGAARAASIQVTMKNDVVANDGRCSLREAVTAANLNARSGSAPGECVAGDPSPGVDVILLRRGSYKLSLGLAGDDLNLGGDLDVTGSMVVQGKGRAATKIKNGIGSPAVTGDGDRLFHIDPSGVGGIDASFRNLTLLRGDVSCSGVECASGASAVEMSGSGALTFDTCDVLRNVATCFGDGCGTGEDGAAIRAAGGGALTIVRSRILKNAVHCADAGCSTGAAAIIMLRAADGGEADFTLNDSFVTQNSAACFGERCFAGGVTSISARTISLGLVDVTENAIACEGPRCRAANACSLFSSQGTTLDGVEVSANGLECAGERCGTGSVLEGQGGARDVLLRNVVAQDDEIGCVGKECVVGSVVVLRAGFGDVALEDLVLTRVSNGCFGADCVARSLLDVDGSESLQVRGLEVTEASSGCAGVTCAALGTLRAGGGVVAIDAATVVASDVSCSSTGCRAGSIVDVDSDTGTTAESLALRDNLVACTGLECRVQDLVDLSAVEGPVTLGASSIGTTSGQCSGSDCSVQSLLGVFAAQGVSLDDVTVETSELFCQGGRCGVEPLVDVMARVALAVTGADVDGNTTECRGDGCHANPVVRVGGPLATIAASRFAANRARCEGAPCSVGFGGALHNAATRLTVADTSFIANATDGFGAGIFNAPQMELVLQRVELANNAAGLRGTMEFGGAGGAIYNDADGTTKGVLSLRDSLVRDNQARLGGGILNEGTLSSLTGSALDGNVPTNCVDLGGTGCP